MKRMMFFAIALVVAMGINASNNARANWNKSINIGKLSNYLKLDSKQSEEVAQICEFFTHELGKASVAKKDQQQKLQRAVYGNLKLMKQTLNKEQYAKYTTLINLTLRNRGIELEQ